MAKKRGKKVRDTPRTGDSASRPRAPTRTAAATPLASAGVEVRLREGAGHLHFAWTSDEGPNHANEDRVVVINDLLACRHHPIAFVAVIDGHDGGRCAAFLKRRLPELVRSYLLSEVMPYARVLDDSDGDEPLCERCACARSGVALTVGDLSEALRSTCSRAEDTFLNWARGERNSSGACAVICLIAVPHVVMASVGDCAATLVHGPELPGVRRSEIDPLRHRASERHNVENANEVQRVMEAGGKITDDRVFGILEPTRSFGDVDLKTSRRHAGVVIAEPTIHHFVASPRSYLLAASDGLWDYAPGPSTMQMLHRFHEQPEQASKCDAFCRDLVTAARKHDSEDDVTVALLIISSS